MADINPKFNTLIYEKDKEQPQIVWITLNRPDKTNAISIGHGCMTQEIMDAMAMVNEDDDVKVAIFKGAGDNFCAGYDLEMVYRVYGGTATFKPYQRRRLMIDDTQITGFIKAINNCCKVTMCMMHGWCIEAGIWIGEACDITVAAENAKFAHRGNRLAFGGMPSNVLEILGGNTKKLTEILITGRTISGVEAAEIGVITKAVPEEDLESDVYNLAKAICTTSRDAITMGKLNRRALLNSVGVLASDFGVVYHTLATNLRYAPDEDNLMFIKDREGSTASDAFHKLHKQFEEALSKTKHFKSFRPAKKA